MRWWIMSLTGRSLPWSSIAICTRACHSSFHTDGLPLMTAPEHVLHVRVVEEAERDGEHALALEVVHVAEVHRGEGVLVERVHRPHATLERVEEEVRPCLPT